MQRVDTQPLARTPGPRRRLGTRLALVLLPLVLLPLILMGVSAYLRSQQLLREQVVSRLSSASVADRRVYQSWVLAREDRLNLAVQSATTRRLLDAAMAGGSDETLAATLASLTEGNQALFTEVLLVHAPDGAVVTSTDPTRQGGTLAAVPRGDLPSDEVASVAAYNDPLASPGGFALVTSVPVPSAEGTTEAYLIGVNRDQQVMSLLRQMQGFWPRAGAFEEDAGYAYFLVPPDMIVRLPEYIFATAPEVLTGQSHPMFGLAKVSDSGDAEYPSVSGVPVLGTYEWVADQDLGIVLEVPETEVYGGLASLAPFTIGLVTLALAISFIVVVFATNRLLRPLGDLTQFAERISRGDWEHRVPEGRSDEIGTLAAAFNRMADDLSGLYGSLEARVEERTRQVRTAAEVAHAVTSTPNLDDLLRRAVDLIRERFGYDHVTIFLLDADGRRAIVREATGEVGQLMKARGHSLEVGSQSIIGWVTANNQGRIATDVGRDPIHLRNELLPDTRSEAAVPLQVSGRVLGALDVQSTRANAFRPEDIEILQTLADQLSAAIQNARLAQESAVAAERAKLMSAVTGQFGGLMDVERVLETAAQTLHQVLGRPEIVITMATDAAPTASEGGNGRE